MASEGADRCENVHRVAGTGGLEDDLVDHDFGVALDQAPQGFGRLSFHFP